MSQETLEWLQQNTRIGFTERRGTAWHASRGADGEYLNHYPGPVPIEEVIALMSIPLVEGTVTITVPGSDGEPISFIDPHRKAIVRLDTLDCFNVPTNAYQIHSYVEWCVNNLERFAGELQVGATGLLRGGRQAFVQAELPDTREAAEGVLHRPFLSAVTSADGSIATTFLAGTQVIHCDNMLRAGLSEKSALKVKIRHSSKSLGRIDEHRETLGVLVEQVGDAFEDEVAELTSRVITDDQWNEFVKRFSNPTGKELEGRSKSLAETKARDLNYLWNYDERVAPWKGNAYGVLVGVNTFAHHFQNVKGMERAERNYSRMVTGDFEKLDASTLALLAQVS